MLQRVARGPFVAALLALTVIDFARAAPAQVDCFVSAGRIHHVDPRLLVAIAKVESGTRTGLNPDAINPYSGALGVMQIMPTNFKALARYDISPQDLRDPCTNINTGAWILSQFLRQYGATWRAVGAYGVGNGAGPKFEAQRSVYAAKVRAKLLNIEGQQKRPVPAKHKPHAPHN